MIGEDRRTTTEAGSGDLLAINPEVNGVLSRFTLRE
jgi:hypothetical protein